MSTISGKRLRIRRGDGTRTLANGELEFDYVNSKLRVGDGSSVVASDYQVKADLTSLVQAQDMSFRVKLIF